MCADYRAQLAAILTPEQKVEVGTKWSINYKMLCINYKMEHHWLLDLPRLVCGCLFSGIFNGRLERFLLAPLAPKQAQTTR